MSDIFGNASSANLNDVVITDSTTNGSFTITTLNNETYNLQTPDNGDNLDVLTTDGVGNTYWAPSGGGGSGIVYNGILPIPVGQHITINPFGTEVYQSVINESATNLDVNGLNITNANDINANQLKNISGNVLYFNTDDNITILNNKSLLTTKTTFTEDQEFITKKYVDDNIPTAQTFQDVYDNSSNPTIVEMKNGKDISFRRLEADILKIGTDFTITTPNIDTQKIEGDYYFPYSSNNLDSWSFATYNFTASASSFVNFDHNPGRAFNKFIPSNHQHFQQVKNQLVVGYQLHQ